MCGDRLGWSGTLVLPLSTKLPADAVVIAGAVPPVDVTAIVVLPKIAVLPADAVLPTIAVLTVFAVLPADVVLPADAILTADAVLTADGSLGLGEQKRSLQALAFLALLAASFSDLLRRFAIQESKPTHVSSNQDSHTAQVCLLSQVVCLEEHPCAIQGSEEDRRVVKFLQGEAPHRI